MDGVEPVEGIRHGVRLNKLEGIIRLAINVHSHDLEAGPVVAHRGTTSAAEQVK